MPLFLILAPAGCTVGINGSILGGGGDGSDASASDNADLTVDQSALPCDIARIVADNCLSCHSVKSEIGGNVVLGSYEELTAISPAYNVSYASRALKRMSATVARMPPSTNPAVPDADIKLFADWVNGGTPRGSCQPAGPDLGAADFSTYTPDLAGQVLTQSGLPCDVASVLANCLGCHGSPASGGATISLVTLKDLTAAFGNQGSVAQVALGRMKDANNRMPPPPNAALTAQQIDAFANWVAANTPEGSCGMQFDAGVPVDPYDTPDVCTSKVTWPGGEQDIGGHTKVAMHPGVMCIDCHTNPGKYGVRDKGPTTYIAGTVYPTAHEPDECFGASGQRTPATVEVTDATNRVYTLATNESGNFYLLSGLNVVKPVMPIKAVVKSGGRTRAMKDPVPSGDCNSCHTLRGTMSAPGRIMLP